LDRVGLLRIVACVNACEGIPTEALEAGVIRDLIDAATRYLRVMTRDTDDDPNCWAEEEHAETHLREVLAKVLFREAALLSRQARRPEPEAAAGRVEG